MLQFAKRNFLYVVCAILSLGILCTAGVYAVDNYLKMKMSFIATPSILCSIDVKINSGTYYNVFSNYTTENINSNINRIISGNSLALSGGIFSNLENGDKVYIKVTNGSTDNTKRLFLNISNTYTSGPQVAFENGGNLENVLTNGVIVGTIQTLTASKIQLSFDFSLEPTKTEYAVSLSSSNVTLENTQLKVMTGNDYYTKIVTSDDNYMPILTSITMGATTLTEGVGAGTFEFNDVTGDLIVHGVTGAIAITATQKPIIITVTPTLGSGVSLYYKGDFKTTSFTVPSTEDLILIAVSTVAQNYFHTGNYVINAIIYSKLPDTKTSNWSNGTLTTTITFSKDIWVNNTLSIGINLGYEQPIDG